MNPISTGSVQLDRLLDGGIQPGQLTVIAGAVASGKTTLLNAILDNAASGGREVMLFSPHADASPLTRDGATSNTVIAYDSLNDFTDVNEANNLAADLNVTARQFGYTAIATATLAKGRAPTVNAIVGSASITNSAAVVLILNPAGDMVDVIVAKNRHGATGTVTVAYDPDRQRFVDLVTA